VNDTLNAVKSVLTETELPTILEDGSFSGNVDATYTQTIVLGSNPIVTFAKEPTSQDDPDFGLSLSTNAVTPIYNATVSFNKAVNLSHADSEGESITLFGQTFTIASATDKTSLVLLKSAERISIDSDNPTADVTIADKAYTVELISSSDDAATIRVTDSSGNSYSKEINEAASKKVNGVTIAVQTADETNLKLSATIIVGAEKVTLTSGSSVTTGEEGSVIEGTSVYFTGGFTDALQVLQVSIAASDNDVDAIRSGNSMVDPVFGSFKVDFAGMTAPMDSSARETISINPAGDDKVELTMTDSHGDTLSSFQWARNLSTKMELQVDEEYRNITVFERGSTYRNEYIMVGNEDEGRLLRVSTISNATTGYDQDAVKLVDAFSGDIYEATLTSDGAGTITIAGKVYALNYYGSNTVSSDARYIKLNYPDSTAATSAVLYPTIETSKGAKVAFYEPTTINLTNWDGAESDLATLRLPNGNGFDDTTFAVSAGGAASTNWTVESSTLETGVAGDSITATVGSLTYNITTTANMNETVVYLINPGATGGNIVDPALVIFEEKDDNTDYQAIVVTLEAGATSDDGIGVDDTIRTWSADLTWDSITMPGDSKISKEADLYGVVITTDGSDSDQKSVVISYPDEQVDAQIYIGEETASIVAGGQIGSGDIKVLGSVSVSDNELGSVSSKNLIVVGGSCVNSVAADLLGGSLCSADFTAKTGVESGQFLIETFSRTGGTVATLVAGYNAADTTNAAKALTTQIVDIADGVKYTGTTSTSITQETITA